MNNQLITDFKAGKKAFDDAMTKTRSEIDAAGEELNKLRAEMKT